MRRNWIRFTVIAAAIAAVGVAAWHWQMKQLSNSFKSVDSDKAQTVTLGAMADLVLDNSVLRDLPSTNGKAILDQYRENPNGYDERAKFVITWQRASSLIKAVSLSPIPTNTAISSSTLTQALPDDRVDAWNSPFCVYSTGTKVAVLSGGADHKQRQCDALNGLANRLARTIATKKLVKDDAGWYVVVQAIPPHS